MATEPLDHSGSASQRMDRIETQVSTLSSTVTALSTALGEFRGELRTVAASLASIVSNLEKRDREEAEAQRASKPNVVAIIAVMVTIISALIGGAWLISGQLSRFDERDLQRDKQVAKMQLEIQTLERRQWEGKK